MNQRTCRRLLAGLAALASAACAQAQAVDSATKSAAVADVVVTEASFRCIREMKPVRGFFVDNLLGDVDATLAVAQAPAGKTYPPGTLIQVIPNTVMVKHQSGRSPATNDWEFIDLNVTAAGASIFGRGFAEMTMRSGPACLSCHQPAKSDWDLVCEQNHGCLPIPLTPAMIRALQNTDPRCPKIELPKEQVDALAELAARRAAAAAAPAPR